MPRSKGTVKVSPTSLNLLRECPRCFWLQFKQGITRPKGPFPSLPASLDRLVKAACQPFHDTDRLPPFLAAAGLRGRLVAPSLEAWQDPETGLVVSGYLDECLEVPGQGFAPLDHKTRGSRTETINAAYYVQLDVYALMLQGNGRPLLGEGYLVYYIPDSEWDPGQNLTFIIDVRTIIVNPKRALALVQEARRVLGQAQAPDSSPQCNYCRWSGSVSTLLGEPAFSSEGDVDPGLQTPSDGFGEV